MNGDEARDIYEGLSVEQRRCLIAVLTEEYVVSFPYYSKVIMSAPRVGGPGGGTYTIPQGAQVRAFSYAYDSGTAITAGFPPGLVATRGDTNLGKSQETNSGESVEIFGLCIQPIPAFPRDVSGAGTGPYVSDIFSDGRFLALCDDACSVNLQLNAGREGYDLGAISMMPGAGGFEGTGLDQLGTQAIQGGRLTFGYMTNGRPDYSNCFDMPEGLVWLPSGRRDSMINVRFQFDRGVIAYTGGDLGNNAAQGADVAPAAGVRGYVYPGRIGAALMVHLKGKTVSKRSMVS